MKESKEPEELKRDLEAALAVDSVDYGRVLSLAQELAQSDPNYMRFSVDAALISRLGRELVGRKETALAELIKNAYDADSPYADLLFVNPATVGGTLVITDAGSGMTRDQTIDGFMRISTPGKIDQSVSPRFRRLRAGRKGIGRFAAQRLGERLVLTTQTRRESMARQISFDWSGYQPRAELSSIANPISQVKKERSEGTTLKIMQLRDSWSDAELRKVYQQLEEITQPFPLSKTDQDKGKDPGFRVKISREINGKCEEVATEETEVYQYALAIIEGTVESSGMSTWSVSSSRLALKSEGNAIEPLEKGNRAFLCLRDVGFRAYYFIWESTLVARAQIGRLRNLARSRGGIRVYRNGFRVLPYGEPGDDWLGLDESSRARRVLPPHANGNFFGFVELKDPGGVLFEETSSREGLVQNDAFRELQHLVRSSLMAAVLRVASARNRKQTTSQKSWSGNRSKPSEGPKQLENLAILVRNLTKDITGTSVKVPLKTSREIETQLKSVARVQRQLLQELEMLRVLASLGLAIAEFTHEVRFYLPAIRLDVDAIASNCSGDKEVLRLTERLDENLNSIQSFVAFLDSSASANVSRNVEPIELRSVVRAFVESISAITVRSGVEVKTKFKGFNLRTVPMHISEWASILFNLFTNAQKAILKKGVKGEILIEAGRSDSRIWMEFNDNGVGIPEENRKHVFEAFFTTSTPAHSLRDEGTELLGTGLGLKLVRDMVEGVNGNTSLVDAREPYVTCIRLEFPAADNLDDAKD